MAKCTACDRDAHSKNLCEHHELAFQMVKKNYTFWCEAYGDLSWKEYLERLLERKETGSWVKDIVQLERRK